MRLIDADALLKELESSKLQPTKDTDGFIDGWCEGFNTVVGMIRNQPTAFNMEKVVEQLENVIQDLNVIEILSQFDPDSTIQTSLDRFLNAVRNEVLNIVKKGGVE